jgi:hypothetical protein
MRPRRLLVALAGLALACGRALVSPDGGTTTRVSGSEDANTSASSTGESSESDTSTSEDPTVGLLDDGLGSGSGCSPFAQDCPEGEKCMAYDKDGEPGLDDDKCVPVLGDGVAGQPCTWDGPQSGTDDCDGAHACYFVADTGGEWLGTCAAFCQGIADDPICPHPLGCYIAEHSTPALCVPSCDPLVQDCIDVNAVCQWARTEFLCLQRGPDVAVGEPCELETDCVAGSLCLDAEVVPGCADTSCCAAYCELGMVGACDSVPGTGCEPFFLGPVPPGYELVGVCI